MTLAVAFFMTEAILMFSPESSLLSKYSHAAKTTGHGLLQAATVLCALSGFGAIWYNKELKHRAHFTSWHGTMGVITITYICVQILGGIALKMKWLVGKRITLAQNKLYHATSGLLLYLCGLTTLSLGIYSGWFTQRVQVPVQYACLGSVVILAFTVVNQVTKAYLAKK
ncbi:PREDICTED: cytochrome b561 domain-containing protein 2-like [Priapulus caudatus]|uniref:ascorbate ferrireductase (transmembrane) n=1 Tax=Priapulus caudatus TaxID=37621 RepID=A0ABM1EGP4_PRICU|nr:PREDICTED: cytochrome b561 domain-containing protein 2-like [Priapulus caudatus]